MPSSRESLSPTPGLAIRRRVCAVVGLIVTTALVACGGGGGGSSNALAPVSVPPAPVSETSDFDAGVFAPSSNFQAMCEVPRVSSAFNDVQGSSVDENDWLRSMSNELYLWYDEIVDRDPENFATPEYFDLMRTTALTPSGTPRDQFHFTINTEAFRALSQSGITVGYGMELAVLDALPPRDIVIAFTEPNTPAASPAIDLRRGMRILEVDGRDAVNGQTQADVDALNAGLFPTNAGETHSFLVADGATGETRSVTLAAEQIVTDPVQNVKVVETANGAVGYLTFNSHIDTAEAELFDAMTQLETAGVTELVLDLRYNGGGLLLIANQVAAMIAGPAAASGRVFDELQFNDKHTQFDPVTGQPLQPDFFLATTVGRGDSAAGRPLPALNLNRVFVLGGEGTCSASETIINGLRGIDVDVVLIGESTCGKPYGFYPLDNCGTTYFTVQFRGVNAKNFGDYADGFVPANLSGTPGLPIPGCAVGDDFSKPLGDPTEARFAAALAYMNDGSCPEPPVVGLSRLSAVAAEEGAEKSTAVSAAAAIATAPAVQMPGSVQMQADGR